MTTTKTETADTVDLPTDHSNWRDYTHYHTDLIFMHPENQWDEKTYHKKLSDYLFFNNKTLGQMADDGPEIWSRERGIGRKAANVFINLINNLAGKRIVGWSINHPENKNVRKSTAAILKEEERHKQRRAAVYKMRFETHNSWKEIAKAFGVSTTQAKAMDRRHRVENNLPSKYVDNLNQQLVDLRNDIHSLKSDFYLLAKYLRNNNNHEVAHLIEQRLERKR